MVSYRINRLFNVWKLFGINGRFEIKLFFKSAKALVNSPGDFSFAAGAADLDPFVPLVSFFSVVFAAADFIAAIIFVSLLIII